MARYREAVCRVCRRYGEKLFLKGGRCPTTKCTFEKKPAPPGQQSLRRRSRLSEYGLQLKEKQKARHIYGVLERQFRRHFAEAARRTGLTGGNLLQILEMRLDNVVYRLGFADSRPQARQVVRHGHITLNGRKTDIPSCLVKVGDVIAWKEESRKLDLYKRAAEGIESKNAPSWLNLDKGNLSGRVLGPPPRNEIDSRIDERVIVEFYSRKGKL